MTTFDNIILNGRPGGGKSELIDFLKKTPTAERIERYHLGEFVELDDFTWLWEKFVEDDLWEQLGQPRLYSRTVPGGYVQTEGDRLLDMLMLKFDQTVTRDHLADPSFYADGSVFIEFARGVADGGYRRAYESLSDAVLQRAAIVYIFVSFEESQRRNEARYQAALAHSILAHRLPEEAIQRFSAQQDFMDLAGGEDSGYLDLRGIRVPFVVIHNAPELKDRDALEARYTPAMQTLWRLQQER